MLSHISYFQSFPTSTLTKELEWVSRRLVSNRTLRRQDFSEFNDVKFSNLTTCEIKCRISMAKAGFNKKRTPFTSTLDLELRKKIAKCYVWSIALYGGETWTLRAVDKKHLESSEMWCWRRNETISWTDL